MNKPLKLWIQEESLHLYLQEAKIDTRGVGNVCICPLTEGSLADGIPQWEVAKYKDRIVVGTDSNLRIDFRRDIIFRNGIDAEWGTPPKKFKRQKTSLNSW